MIFNMGGRPGQAVCRRLFERRGLRVDQLWQTKILQVLIHVYLFDNIQMCTFLDIFRCRLPIQTFQLWLKLKRIAHTVLSSSWV